MLDKILTSKIKNFLDLIRFHQPIGFLLLMWPCWFSISLLNLSINQSLKWYILFLIGSFLMRSAGCIINDIIDINIDKNIERTSQRPLTSKKISINEALICLFLILSLSLVILFQFNLKTIIIGLVSFPLVILYPFAKRYTYLPQFFLGLVFSWGVLIVSFEFQNGFNLNFLFLYFGCICWTVAYDTIYAYQDRDDDIINNIKSTAVLMGKQGIKFIKFFYFIFFSIIGYLSWQDSQSFYSLVVIILFIFSMNINRIITTKLMGTKI